MFLEETRMMTAMIKRNEWYYIGIDQWLIRCSKVMSDYTMEPRVTRYVFARLPVSMS